jgi:hypothetical protein
MFTHKITEVILSGMLPNMVRLAELLKPFPLEWAKQDEAFLKSG